MRELLILVNIKYFVKSIPKQDNRSDEINMSCSKRNKCFSDNFKIPILQPTCLKSNNIL